MSRFLSIFALLPWMLKAMEIVLPEQPTPTELTAKHELEAHLAKCVKRLLTPNQNEIRQVHLGDTELAGRLGLLRGSMKTDSFVIHCEGETLLISGGGTRGVLYGLYDFLEQDCGFRFYSQAITCYPTLGEVKLKTSHRQGEFFFPMRDIYIAREPQDGGRFAISRGLSRDGDRKITPQFGGAFDYGPPYSCHTFDRYLPAAKHLKEHPEWYSLRDGKRVGGQSRGQLCLTNPELRETFARLLLQNIRDTNAKAKEEGSPAPLIYDVSHNDNSRYCQCPACEAFTARENQSGLMIDFLNFLADKVKAEFPQVMLQFFAYQYNSEPPRTICARDNVIVRICNTGSNLITGCAHDATVTAKFQSWRKFVKHIYVWEYGITYGDMTGLPYPSEYHIPDTYRFYADNQVSGVFLEHEAPDRADMWELKHYLHTKYLAYPYRTDFQELVNDFYRHFHGPAAEHVQDFRRILRETAERRQAVIGWFASPVDFSYIDWPAMKRMQEAMELARQAVKGDAELTWRVNRASMGIDRMLALDFRQRYFREAGTDLTKMATDASQRFWATWEESLRRNRTPNPERLLKRIHERAEALIALPPIRLTEKQRFPEELQLDFFAADVATIGNSVKPMPDPTSEYGSCVQIDMGKSPSQRFPQTCGLYSLSQSKELQQWRFEQEEFRSGEWKWMELKDIYLPPHDNCYLYYTNSWVVQTLLAYLSPIDRTRPFNARIHIRFEGEQIFHDGKPATISIDRINLWQPLPTKK